MMWGNYGMGLWGWAFGGLLLVGVVILVVLLIRMSLSSGQRSTTLGVGDGDSWSPKQILDERYAKGELTSEEYRERLATLGLKP